MNQSFENSDKTFSREEMESIVEQRLARERKNNEQLKLIRELVNRLRKKEPYRSLSNAALAELLWKKLAETAPKDTEADALPRADGATAMPEPSSAAETTAEAAANMAEQNHLPEDSGKNPPAVLAEPPVPGQTPEQETDAVSEKTALPAETSAAVDPSVSGRPVSSPADSEQERRQKELHTFLAAYGEERLSDALHDEAFRAFCMGKQGSLTALYESYLTFLSALSQSRDARRYRAAESHLASTGFSGNASGAPDYGSMLSENQKSLAKASGMSFRQYAELLGQIPTKKL